MSGIYIYNDPHIFRTVKYKTDAKKQVNPTTKTTTKYTLRKQLVHEEVHQEKGDAEKRNSGTKETHKPIAFGLTAL
jgi:hypothetical protein